MANLRTRRPRLDPDSFIAAADVPLPGEGREEIPPWERPGVRDDVTKPFNLRLPEPLKLKLDHIRGRTRVSVHEFIMAALVPAVEAEIERLHRENSHQRQGRGDII
jgi:hypothetical protein